MRATQLWQELEVEAGERLFHQTGVLTLGPPDGPVIRGTRLSAEQHHLELHEVPASNQKALGLRPPPGSVGVFEPAAGFLEVEACVRAHVALAARSGAEIRVGQAVARWHRTPSGVEVVLANAERYQARTLVVTPGAWASDLLDLPLRFEIRRKHLHWFASTSEQQARALPVYFVELPGSRYYYGFPDFDGRGLKVAEHSGGRPVRDPLWLDRSLDPRELRDTKRFVTAHLPLAGAHLHHEVCMYTVSDDEHFVVEFSDPVIQIGGLSGHGFKFASVLGELAADLLLTGQSSLPYQFLSSARFR
ncbi:MAG: N-methyl-L-tryptophan oxidase [Myxococcota bacterium]